MRKFIYITTIRPNSFNPYIVIKEKDESGKITEILSEELFQHPLSNRFTPEEIAKIDKVNAALDSRGERRLSDEEIEYLIDPMGLKRLEEKTPEPKDMQHLAGFKVEKKIVSV